MRQDREGVVLLGQEVGGVEGGRGRILTGIQRHLHIGVCERVCVRERERDRERETERGR